MLYETELTYGIFLQADLARRREVTADAGCAVAVKAGAKFIETSAGLGHCTDELLVGITVQCR